MIKSGIVMCIMNKKAGIMTSGGEFVYIKTSKTLPKVGEIHTGQLCNKNLFLYKYAITAALLMFVIVSSASAYAYYAPVTTIVLNINPSVSLKANRWNKIISSKALNSEGSLLLNNIKLKNKSIDAGLELIVKEAKAENFINDKFVNDKKVISVDIKSNKNNSIDISNFRKMIVSNKLNYIINASSSNNKKIDITVNNKKIDTSTLNSNRQKEEFNNKNLNIKIDPPKKPLVDIKTNKIENKSSKTKVEIKKIDNIIKNENNNINKAGKEYSRSMNNNEKDNPSTIKKFIKDYKN